MNLWAKRIGQLVIPVALFFSCEDEAKLLGYKNPNTKFEASYVEIPIESSVLLLDSQRTSNFTFTNETNRLLVGQYIDEKLGTVSATAYTQFFTSSSAKLPTAVTYDSVTLQLVLDYYNYGSRQPGTDQTISVYELSEGLEFTTRRNYFNTSEAQINSFPLGSKTFPVDPDSLDYYAKNQNDSTFRVNLKLDQAFGQRIFETAEKWRDYSVNADSAYIKFSSFTELFKGLAIKSDNGDKILGISPLSTVRVHYHKDTTNSTLDLGFSLVTNFTQIKGDRSATELAGLTQYSTDFYPSNDLRYIQAGTGIYTKVDLGKFFEFADTVPNVVITSAQLVIDGLQQPSLAPPSNLIVRLLNENNVTEKYGRKNSQDNSDIILYNPAFPAHTGTLRYDAGPSVVNESDSSFYVLGDQSPFMVYSSDNNSFSGNYALFFQQLTLQVENRRRFQYYVIGPSVPLPNTKSVNRAVFPKDGIKLRIYYTKPTTPLN